MTATQSPAATTLAEARAAQARLAGGVVRTPLVPLALEGAPARIWLKFELLQPIGSFKLRGAMNAIAQAPPEQLARGVWTASAGNMAQGVAWQARRLGVPCRVVAPDHAPQTKLEAVRRLGAEVLCVPFAQWFQILASHTFPGMEGVFIHPVSDPHVMAGNATIALEVFADLPEVDAVVVPFGGGGLSCGIAATLRELSPRVRVFASEVETAAALSAALAAGRPQRIEYRASFVDGIGSPFVLDEMWPLAQRLLAGSLVVGLDAVASAIRLLVERHRVVAEGAGASALAAALTGGAGAGNVVCVISGGNLDTHRLTEILAGRTPA